MKNLLKHFLKAAFWYLIFDGLILGYIGLIPGVESAAAQTILPQTTLAAAVTTTSQTNMQLTSSTGVIATGSVLFIADGNGEAVFVNNVAASGGYVGVTRGYQNLSAASTHAKGALVFVAVPFALAYQPPTGSCTRASQLYLPVISLGMVGTPAAISDCVGGQWVQGITVNQSPFRLPAPNSGGTAYTALNTTGTTLVAGTLYCEEVDLPFNKNLTGIGILNGTTVGTDKHLAVLLDSQGNVIANSALAGVTSAGASTYQTYAFTSLYYAVGPAQYFACVQSNGTTDTIRMVVTGTQDTYLTASKTGTFGTIPAITVPTTFTTAVGPYSFLY